MGRPVQALVAGLLLLACACGPDATPLPVNLPTLPPPTSSENASTPTTPLLRYAVAPDALPYLSEADRELIEASAQIVPLDAPPVADELGSRYELVVTMSDFANSTPAPNPLQVVLLVNTTLPPLNDPALAEIVRLAIDPQQIAHALNIPGAQAAAASASSAITLRTQLANAGYPDGFDLTLAAPFTAGADALVHVLDAVGLQTRIVTAGNEATHLILTTSPTANAIPLLTIPIYYRAVDGLKITYTPSGFPTAQR